jgi:hypothetical protein
MVQCPGGKLAGFFMRFTIRDVLLVMVIIGLAVGWWIDRGRLAARVAFLEQGADAVMADIGRRAGVPINLTIEGKRWPR